MSLFSMRRPMGYTPHHLYTDPHAERIARLMRRAEGKDDATDVRHDFSTHWAEQTQHLRCRRRKTNSLRLVLLLLLALATVYLMIM